MTHDHSKGDRKFDPGGKEKLDRPERKKLLDPDKIIPDLGISGGQTIADIGAGTGFFSIPFSEHVGIGGKIYSIDISQDMLDAVSQKKNSGNISNIETVLSSEDRIPLESEIADMAFMCTVLHELDGAGTLSEAHRILKKGGRLAIIDWQKVNGEAVMGPPEWHRLSMKEAIKKCEDAGFCFVKEFIVGPEHYGLIFHKA